MELSKSKAVQCLKSYHIGLLEWHEDLSHLCSCDFGQKDEKWNQIEVLTASVKALPDQIKATQDAWLIEGDPDKREDLEDFVECYSIRQKSIQSRIEWIENTERVARLADEYDLNGTLFRDPFPDDDPTSDQSIGTLREQIETIPRIIAEIEKPKPVAGPLVFSIEDMAGLLRRGKSVIRVQNEKGLLPRPLPGHGNLQWLRKEILAWLDAKCPSRVQWERQWKEMN